MKPENPQDPRLQALGELIRIIDRLRAKNGCPWDREQTFASMTGPILEEAYEVIEALEQKGDGEIQEELGDLLMNLFLVARIAQDEGRFDLREIGEGICAKLIRRHPHVFGDEKAQTGKEALLRWEKVKQSERASKKAQGPKGTPNPSVLDGVPEKLPALLRAYRVGNKAARVGFEWPDIEGPVAKCREELGELEEELSKKNPDRQRLEHELGDVLFSVVNLARQVDIDPEAALRKTISRFSRRFRYIEEKLGTELPQASLEEMDSLWEEAKREETDGNPTEIRQ
ncbi:MAG TPA: nucleoside triphosphate pyrophosphohydrolase [Planctomycetes bacterium]|nr:nucleoside triphosphate pyrophosphohydrolase [Planctomycetota bacterium]